MSHFSWYFLNDIPMLYKHSILNAVQIEECIRDTTDLTFAVGQDEIAFGNHTVNFCEAERDIVVLQIVEKFGEAFPSIADVGIVLMIDVADVLSELVTFAVHNNVLHEIGYDCAVGIGLIEIFHCHRTVDHGATRDGFLWAFLRAIPVFDDLAVFDAK